MADTVVVIQESVSTAVVEEAIAIVELTSPGPQGATGSAGATGPQGSTGATGAQGPAGVGIATGGTTGQFLVKTGTADYATGWGNETDPVYSSSPAHNITATDITKLANLSGTNTGDQDLTPYVKHTGATSAVDLGTYGLTAGTLIAKGTTPNITLEATTLNAANAGTLKFQTLGGAESATIRFNGSTNRFEFLYGAQLILSMTSSQLLAFTGSQGAPAYSFNSDTNTGFYLYTADSIGVATGGVQLSRFTTDGSVLNGYVDNQSGGSGGFRVSNATDAVTTIFQSQEYSGGGGLYGSGALYLKSGQDYAAANGDMNFNAAVVGYDTTAGNFFFTNSPMSAIGVVGGGFTVTAGSSQYGPGGPVNIAAGESQDNLYGYVGGAVTINGGNSSEYAGGAVYLNGGQGMGYTGNGGDAYIQGGYATYTTGGSVYINGGYGSSAYGNVNIGTSGGNVYISSVFWTTSGTIYVTAPINDGASYTALDIYSRQFYDSAGFSSVDAANRLLNDNTSTTAISWGTRTLFGSTGTPRLDWDSCIFHNAAGTPVFNWNTQTIADTNFVIAMAAAL